MSKGKAMPAPKATRIVEFIRANITRDLSLALVAKHCGIGKPENGYSNLCISLKNHTGFTFSEFVAKERLEKAAALIKEDKLTIEQIARQLGYRDYMVFVRHFRKWFLVNPSDYRKKVCGYRLHQEGQKRKRLKRQRSYKSSAE